MSTEEMKAIVRRFFGAFEVNDRATLESVLAPELVTYLPGEVDPVNRGVFLDVVRRWADAFSDLHFEIEDLIAERDMVAAHVTLRGVHDRGEFLGIAPLGKAIAITVLTMERVAAGQIVERRVVLDLSELLRQLGVTSDGR